MPRYIESENALEFLQHKYENMYGCNPSFYAGYQFALENLKRIKSADVAPVVHAKWENCDWVEPDYHGCGTIRIPNAGMKCTNCVHVFKKDLLWVDNYCPNCGAKCDLEG